MSPTNEIDRKTRELLASLAVAIRVENGIALCPTCALRHHRTVYLVTELHKCTKCGVLTGGRVVGPPP